MKLIYNQLLLQRKRPINLIKDDLYLFEHEFSITIPQSYFKNYNNAIVTSHGIIIKRYRVALESLPDNRIKGETRYVLHSLLKKNKIKSNPHGLYILTFDRWSNSYFHFITDCLTRLIECEKHFQNAYFIFPKEFDKGFFKVLLSSFNISNIIYLTENECIKPVNLLAPTPIAVSGNYHPLNLKKLTTHLINKFELKYFDKTIYGERIFISRAKAAWRYITNELEVQNLLTKYNFKVVFLEDHSFAEQVTICRNAKYIVSSHGAGLTNCIFMKQGGSVFEMRKKGDDHNNCYYSLANAAELNYFYQNCDYINRQEGNYFDLTIDIELFDKNISMMLAHTNKLI